MPEKDTNENFEAKETDTLLVPAHHQNSLPQKLPALPTLLEPEEIAYIFSEYFNFTSVEKPEKISFPNKVCTLQECTDFYKKDQLSAKNLLQWFKENQSMVENFYSPKDQSPSLILRSYQTQWNEVENRKASTFRAAGAIAFIYPDYFNAFFSSKPAGVVFPPKNSTHEECIKFFNKNQLSAKILLHWFKENRPIVENLYVKKWYQFNEINYQERWKEVVMTELTLLVTFERISQLENDVRGSTSRIFNKAPLEDVLIPYELFGIMHGFLPTVKKKQNIIEAKDEAIRALANCFDERFIQSGILTQVLYNYQIKHPEEFTKFLYLAYNQNGHSKILTKPRQPEETALQNLEKEYVRQKNVFDDFSEKFQKFNSEEKSKRIETLKTDLILSFTQPMGSYVSSDLAESEEIKTGRAIFTATFQDRFSNSIQEKINEGKNLREIIKTIKNNPKLHQRSNRKKGDKGDQEENQHDNEMLNDVGLNLPEFLAPSPSYLSKKIESLRSFVNNIYWAITESKAWINLFGEANKSTANDKNDVGTSQSVDHGEEEHLRVGGAVRTISPLHKSPGLTNVESNLTETNACQNSTATITTSLLLTNVIRDDSSDRHSLSSSSGGTDVETSPGGSDLDPTSRPATPPGPALQSKTPAKKISTFFANSDSPHGVDETLSAQNPLLLAAVMV